MDLSYGKHVEDYVRRLAGRLGVPDFVYQPKLVTKGAANREISDGLLIAGSHGLIVQTKARDKTAGVNDDARRAEAWCEKHAAHAPRQGLGTKRQLLAGDVSVVSMRGYSRPVPDPKNWPILVVLHHSAIPPVHLPSFANTIYMSLDDWLGLHTLIRSTHGLISYVERALAAPISVPIGGERERYDRLAAADVRWATYSAMSVPVLPMEPLTRDELFAADVFTELMEFMADPTSIGWDSDQYLRLIERLDRTPMLARVTVGRKMIAAFQDMVESQSRRSFGVLDRSSSSRLLIMYEYDDSPRVDLSDRSFTAHLHGYTALRHIHATEAALDPDAGTLGVGIVHHPIEGRRYNFVLIEGTPSQMPPDVRETLEIEFGILTKSGGVVLKQVTGSTSVTSP